MSKIYKIKPLKWTGDGDYLRAETPFGTYTLDKNTNREIRWGYCFAEYYDEDNFYCDSIEEGKRLAEENWLKRIEDALKEIK